MGDTLSEKRRRAGRRGAAARWGKQQDESHPGFRSARSMAKLRQGRDDWYRIENRAAEKAEIYIYDEIGGYVGITAADFVEELRNITASQIQLHLNTPGGSASEGIAIYNGLRDHPAHVEVIVDAMAASAGSFIAQAGDRVVMNRGSQMMIHDAWGLAVGPAGDMRSMAEILDRQSDVIAAIYAERAGGVDEDWRALMQAESWFNADEAVEAGLADEKVGRSSETKNSFDLSVFTYGGRDKAPAPVIPAPASTPDDEVDLDFDVFTESLKEAFV